MFKKILFLSLIILSLTFSFNTQVIKVYAGTTPPATTTTAPDFNKGAGKDILDTILGRTKQNEIKSVPAVLNRMIKIFLGLSSTIFLIFLVVGGLKYLGSKGDTSKIKNSFDLVKTGVIGLTIIILAYTITTFVFAQILKIST